MSRKPSRVCFVGCLGAKITEDDLYEFFKSKIGGVETIDLKRDSNGNSRRFALVTFDDPEYAQRAIDELDDTRFNNTIIHVESYKTKRQQNYEREEEFREEKFREENPQSDRQRYKRDEKKDRDDKDDDESSYSSSSSSSYSSSSSSPKKVRKHRHRHRHHSSDKKSKKSEKKSHHHHHHHRSHRH